MMDAYHQFAQPPPTPVSASKLAFSLFSPVFPGAWTLAFSKETTVVSLFRAISLGRPITDIAQISVAQHLANPRAIRNKCSRTAKWTSMHTVANFDRIGEENAFAVLARAGALAAKGMDVINLARIIHEAV